MTPRKSPNTGTAGARRSGEDVAELLEEPAADLDAADAAVQADERATRDGGRDLPNIPLLDASPANPADIKPTWRGWIHAGTFPVTIAAGIVLICLAHGAPAKWASAVFMLTSMLLFGNSALYHRFNWRPRTKVILKRIDHANIFLLIAGTYTPLAVLALPPSKGILLLSLVWAGALLGIGFRVFWITAPRWLYVPIYVALGWAALMYIVDLVDANVAMMVLVLVGGILYTIGAVIYGMKRPNPIPGVFGFHEIFHTLTVLAFLCHWTATLLIALHPAYNAG
ncbi:PAQR family membrane homeostasis protein TrhA [Leifsonia virtsii]|uniref:Hemolysin III family protein n=1 Tax=Leifsonia virtsii TaxID=3035915 RepID=A0ABT8IS80_9MICO|nr:hemolysin III family protein [Leifsonia virtsii]MDN4595630.1 hemolysin III family protein [Leifsonia virtsii]